MIQKKFFVEIEQPYTTLTSTVPFLKKIVDFFSRCTWNFYNRPDDYLPHSYVNWKSIDANFRLDFWKEFSQACKNNYNKKMFLCLQTLHLYKISFFSIFFKKSMIISWRRNINWRQRNNFKYDKHNKERNFLYHIFDLASMTFFLVFWFTWRCKNVNRIF